jgi:hypothetical protein
MMDINGEHKKVGAYIATYNNPYFLRATVLQVMVQTRKPEVLVVHQNNDKESYLWAIEDLLPLCHELGIFLYYNYNPSCPLIQNYDGIPIQYLLDNECDYIFKLDHDDIYRSNHFSLMIGGLEQGHDLVANRKAGIIFLKKKGYEYNPQIDFAEFNPMDIMASSMAFTRAFGTAYMSAVKDQGDTPCVVDNLMRDKVLPHFDGKVGHFNSDNPSTIYLCYGGNISTSHWIDDENQLISD